MLKLLIPKDHPRRESLEIRERISECFKDGIIIEQGLIAHGRGEAFDYLLGEKTTDIALDAIKASAASLLLATNPVISVNGNSACLCSKDIVELANTVNAKIEVNLFYRSKDRVKAIANLLRAYNTKKIYGVDEENYTIIEELSSNRRIVDKDGIYSADLVLIPLEDGDRTRALINMNKRVIAIDLNPLSRTAQLATISIIDNIIRAIPLINRYAREYKVLAKDKLEEIVNNFDNKNNLEMSLYYILRGLR